MNDFTSELMQALEASISHDNDLRQRAEQYINSSQRRPGYIIALLNISASKEINYQVALAAAVQLGTIVEHHWKFLDETHAQKIAITGFQYVILDEATDKHQLRMMIVQKMYECDYPLVLKQYERCIRSIARLDYPNKWPTLLTHDIPNLLQTDGEKAVYTGLLALLGLVQKYEYELEDDRVPLYAVLDKCFGILGHLINKLMQHTESEIALKILHLICKVFYTSNQLVLAPFLCDVPSQAIAPWMQFFNQLLKLQVPDHLTQFTEDINEVQTRDKAIQWKIKGMAAKITYRVFSKYANPVYSKDEYKLFIEYFSKTFSEQLLETNLALMFSRKTSFVGSKCLNFNIKLVSASVKIPMTMAILKPFIQSILYETAIPIMMATQRDIQLFNEDPIEYIRKQEDFTETLYMPKNTVIDLVQYICMHKSDPKGRADYLIPFLNYAVENMTQYKQLCDQGYSPDWRVKEALLCAVGHLQSQIDEERQMLNQMMEPMLMTHVMPDLESNQPFLRSRACWVYGEFSSFQYQDEKHVKLAIDGIYKSLFAEDLPTRLSAAVALSQMLTNKTARDFLKPALKQILEMYLKLMDEIDSEKLVSSLETIMGKFKDDMGPYAVQVAGQLVTQYQRLIQVDVEEDDGESALAAVGCVSGIRRLLDSVNKEPHMLHQLQSVIYPLLMHGLTPDGLDAIEDVLDCIAIILYYGNSVNSDMWRLFPQMLYIAAGADNDVDGGYGHEYLSQITTCVQNYIAKDPQTFLGQAQDQELSYQDMTNKFLSRILCMNQTSTAKLDGVVALKIAITLFENLPGQIQPREFNNLLGMLLAELQVLLNKKKPEVLYQSMLLQSIALSFYNNAALAFQICESNQMTIPLFQTWLTFMPKFSKEFELRRVIFGLISILRCPSNQYPQLIAMRIQDLFKTTSELCLKQYNTRIESVTENEKMIAEEQEEIKNGVFENVDDNSDEDIDDDEDEFERTKNALKKFKDGVQDDADYDDEDDSDYEFAGGDMNLYDSKLDDLDELNFMKDTINQLFTNQQAAAQMIGGFDTSALVQTLHQVDSLRAREAATVTASEEISKLKD